jgi:lycopene cyclase domain-containing protein
LNQHFLYLALNLLSVSVPFILSFYSKAPFVKKWKYFWPAALITAFVFVVWDEIFTRMGVWGFNPKYVLGKYLIDLPVEEILFFICIPYACVFTYEAVGHFVKDSHFFARHQHQVARMLAAVLLIVGLLFAGRLYTSVTFISLSVFLIFLEWKLKPNYLGRFFLTFIIILIPFFIVNGILTGSFIDEEVVWYNNAENLGVRIGTIPVEDIFYGMLMLLMNVVIFERLQSIKTAEK